MDISRRRQVTLGQSLDAVAEVLNELGGLAELEEHDGGFVVRGYSCPLAGVTPAYPELCRMAEALIAELTGMPVHERCDRGGGLDASR